MKKIAVLLYDSLKELKDEYGVNSYCVRLLGDYKIKVVPNPDSSRTIITSAAFARIMSIVDVFSKYIDIACYISNHNGLPCVNIYFV